MRYLKKCLVQPRLPLKAGGVARTCLALRSRKVQSCGGNIRGKNNIFHVSDSVKETIVENWRKKNRWLDIYTREGFSGENMEAERDDARYCHEEDTLGEMDERMQSAVRRIVPALSTTKYKGQDGRIGIFGGSAEYTGAPYFAAIGALRTGADLVHVFCAKDAGIALKSSSPEPIVHPILDQSDAGKRIRPWLERLHVILVGPGLGRDERIFKTVAELINVCRELKKPMIIDADGLYLVSQRPDLVKEYPGLILTPNAMEFSRLAKAFLDKSVQPAALVRVSDVKHLADVVGKNVVILHKGAKDVIADGHKGTETISCGIAGSARRCGGQGDVLAGALAVFWWWAMSAGPSECAPLSPAMIAAYAASRLTRECNAAAFKMKRRGTLTSDMLEQVQPVFERLFEASAGKPSSFTGIRSRTRSTDSNALARSNQ